jgi:hypothetical protein
MLNDQREQKSKKANGMIAKLKDSHKLILATLFTILVWVWNKYGNFKEVVREYGIESLQIILLLICVYTLFILRKFNWYYRGLPIILIGISVLHMTGLILLSTRYLIIIPVLFIFFLFYYIDWVRNKSQN